MNFASKRQVCRRPSSIKYRQTNTTKFVVIVIAIEWIFHKNYVHQHIPRRHPEECSYCDYCQQLIFREVFLIHQKTCQKRARVSRPSRKSSRFQQRAQSTESTDDWTLEPRPFHEENFDSCTPDFNKNDQTGESSIQYQQEWQSSDYQQELQTQSTTSAIESFFDEAWVEWSSVLTPLSFNDFNFYPIQPEVMTTDSYITDVSYPCPYSVDDVVKRLCELTDNPS